MGSGCPYFSNVLLLAIKLTCGSMTMLKSAPDLLHCLHIKRGVRHAKILPQTPKPKIEPWDAMAAVTYRMMTNLCRRLCSKQSLHKLPADHQQAAHGVSSAADRNAVSSAAERIQTVTAGSQQFAKGMMEHMPVMLTLVLWRRAPQTVCMHQVRPTAATCISNSRLSACKNCSKATMGQNMADLRLSLHQIITYPAVQDNASPAQTCHYCMQVLPTCPAPPVLIDSRTICTSP